MNSFLVSGSGFKTTVPPVEGSYECFISDQFSVGEFLGYQSFRFEAFDFETDYNYLNAGAIGNYHFVNEEILMFMLAVG